VKAMRTIYGSNLIPTPFSDVEIAINIPKAKEVLFTLVTNKKCMEKRKNSSLSFMSFSNSKYKELLILQAPPLPKAITTYSALKLVKTCPSSVIISSLAMITSKPIKSQMAPSSVLLVFKPKPKVKSFA